MSTEKNIILSILGLFLCQCMLSCQKSEIKSSNSKLTLSHEPHTSSVRPCYYTQWTPSSWMHQLPSDFSIAQISIPGTHESAALHGGGPNFTVPIIDVNPSDVAKCQRISIAEQLQIGVRYLDIRCRRKGNSFDINHGHIYQNLNFEDVLTTCNTFLQQNPSETIIMKVQEEYKPSKSSESFTQIFNTYCNRYPLLFYKHPSNSAHIIPTLGEARGKIILMKKFENADQVPVGIDASKRQSNATSVSKLSATEKMKVQSIFAVKNAEEKQKYFLPLLDESFEKTGQTSTLYINNTSAYQKLGGKIPTAYYVNIANDMGKYLIEILKNKGKGNTGIIPMDFINASYCKAIIETNCFDKKTSK